MKIPGLKNIIPVIILLFLFGFTQNVLAAESRYVDRDIYSVTVSPGAQVTVTLNVGVLPGDRFYLIDEVIPSGWIIIDSGDLIDAGELNESEAGHLKKVAINSTGLPDTSYTYIIQAPSSTGTYTFTGVYQIEGMGSFQDIGGESSITVQTGGGPGSPPTGPGSTGPGSPASSPGTPTCSHGEITSECVCQGVTKTSGYCCNNVYHTVPCQVEQGPLPILATCNEGEIKPCGSNIGACIYGTRYCKNNVWGECSGGINPTIELCDLIDNDCNGEIDEECTAPENATCADGEIPEMGCFCGGEFCTDGYCYNNVYSEYKVEFPWVLVAVLGGILLTVLLIEVLYHTHKGKDEVTLESLEDGIRST